MDFIKKALFAAATLVIISVIATLYAAFFEPANQAQLVNASFLFYGIGLATGMTASVALMIVLIKQKKALKGLWILIFAQFTLFIWPLIEAYKIDKARRDAK